MLHCLGSVIIFSIYFNFDLFGIAAPEFVDGGQPTMSSTINEGQKLTLSCRAEGEPKPYILWYYDNEQVSNNDNQIKLSGPKLIIRKITSNQSGKYACKAFNDFGYVWRNFSVIVGKIPYEVGI